MENGAFSSISPEFAWGCCVVVSDDVGRATLCGSDIFIYDFFIASTEFVILVTFILAGYIYIARR